MPIHDWSRVDANLFHDFHQTWTIGIRNALNSGLLPKGYSALVEQHAAGVVPDVIALQRRARSGPPMGGAVVTALPPQTHLVYQAEEISAARANRIAIRHPLGHVVSVIELVSPGNKASRRTLQALVNKTISFLRQGVHVLVVDLFPPSVRDPNGIHPLIWHEFQDDPFELPKDKPLTLAAYVASSPKVAYVELVAVGDPLPDMPAYLDDDSYVPIPLDATYEGTWRTCPDDMRALVEGGAIEP